jgi:hypothetical protein
MPLDANDLNQIREIVRDAQTEILRGLERFARGNFSRLHRLESSDNDLVERLNAFEERLLALENPTAQIAIFG